MGEVTKAEFRRLRDEVRETRELAHAVLITLVGRDHVLMRKIDASIERHKDAEGAGQPLRELVGHTRADRIWREFEVAAVRGLRWFHREEVAALPGIGSETMGKLDAALTAESCEWGDMAEAVAA